MTQQPQQAPAASEVEASRDTGNAGYAIIGFCVPVAGLVLFLVWRQERPQDAKYAGIGALISVVLPFAFVIIYLLIIAIIFMVAMLSEALGLYLLL